VEKVLIFAGMALATYATRYTMIAVLGQEIPPLLRRWLRYVPAAVLAALVAPAALAPQGKLEFGIRAWALVAATAIAWLTRNVLATIAAGLVVFWILRIVGVG
jgi:branched-subunit amino acid transport protein